MRLQRYHFFFAALLILASLLIGFISTSIFSAPKAVHAADNGLLAWPFSTSEASWQIEVGYDAGGSADHNCNVKWCYERFGFDLIATNRATGGLHVYSPATGRVYAWPHQASDGSDCFVVALGTNTNMYAMVCHLLLSNTSLSFTHIHDLVGVIPNTNSHIHISLFYSPDPNTLTPRTPIPFADPWMIGGCNYQLAPGEDPNTYAPDPNASLGYYSGVAVPCSNGGGVPNLSFQWGSTSWPGIGISLNRSVLVEVRNTIDSSDLFSQTVTTDSSGHGSLTLAGITPGYYTLLVKPTGFLRQATNITLQAGANSASFPMTVSGNSCIDGKPTGPQMWLGDVNGDNVINDADYNIIYNYFNKAVPTGYADLDGASPPTFSGVDYNIWLRSMCYFGGGSGQVVGAGGRQDTPIGQAGIKTSVKPTAKPTFSPTQLAGMKPSQRKFASSGGGALSLWPYTGNYRVGQSFTLSVQASVPVPLTGVDMVIEYDPHVLSITAITPTNVFPSTLVHSNDTTKGEINISSVSNPGQPVNIGVSATLANITFQVIGSGQTNITFDYNANSNAHSDMTESGVDTQILSGIYDATITAGILRVPQDYAKISSALAAAQSAETVLVAPGTYHEQFSVPAGVILQGQDRDTTIIDGDGVTNQAVIYLGNGATISGFTVQHSGTNFYDAAVWADQGPVTITNMRLMNNSMGVVRYCYNTPCSGNSTISNNIIIHNVNTGILVHATAADVVNNTVVDNQLQGITFESNGAQGTCIGNILAYNQTGLTATSSTTLANNVLWQNAPNYNTNTTPGPSDIISDPLFINSSASDYRLHAVSPAIQAGNAIGAYPFTATGITPTNLSVTSGPSGVTVSWQTNGQAAGYIVSYALGSSSYFSQTIDVGNNNSYTFSPSLFTGSVLFAVSSYDAQHQESLANYAQATIAATATLTVNPTSGSYNQTIALSGSNFGNSETVNVYLDSVATSPIAITSSDNSGTIGSSFSTPQATSGSHTIIAVGQTSGITASSSFQVKSITSLQHTSGISKSQNAINGYGYAGNETVKAYWKTQGGLLLGTSTTNSQGTSTINFTVPSSTNGNYNVYLVGQSSGIVSSSIFTLGVSKPSLHISPTSGARGSSATVTGTGFGANEIVTIKLNCTSSTCTSKIVLGTVKTDSNGSFTLNVLIPKSIPLGKHTIGAIGGTTRKFASTVYNATS